MFSFFPYRILAAKRSSTSALVSPSVRLKTESFLVWSLFDLKQSDGQSATELQCNFRLPSIPINWPQLQPKNA